MRWLIGFALVAMLALPAAATAQTRGHRPPAAAPAPPVGLPHIGLPLPPVGFSVPGIPSPTPVNFFRPSVPFANGFSGATGFSATAGFAGSAVAPARRRGAGFGAPRGRTPFVGMPVVVYVPQYVVPVETPDPSQPVSLSQSGSSRMPLPSSGLVLQVEPATAQVFVDGYYFGMPEDFDGQRGALALEPGPHKIELIAPGYESVAFNVMVATGQMVRYQNTMKPAAVAPPQPPAAPIAPKTIYVVPGCYVGDVPPKDAGLPATCDIARAVTFAR